MTILRMKKTEFEIKQVTNGLGHVAWVIEKTYPDSAIAPKAPYFQAWTLDFEPKWTAHINTVDMWDDRAKVFRTKKAAERNLRAIHRWYARKQRQEHRIKQKEWKIDD